MKERLAMAWLIEPMMDRIEDFVRMDDYSWEAESEHGSRRVVVGLDALVYLETLCGEAVEVVRSVWEVDGSSGLALLQSFRRAADVHVAMIDRYVKSLKGEKIWMS